MCIRDRRGITYTISPTTEDFRDFSSLKVKDLGDCTGSREEMFAQAQAMAAQAVKAGRFFTMIGGDHSTTCLLYTSCGPFFAYALEITDVHAGPPFGLRKSAATLAALGSFAEQRITPR